MRGITIILRGMQLTANPFFKMITGHPEINFIAILLGSIFHGCIIKVEVSLGLKTHFIIQTDCFKEKCTAALHQKAIGNNDIIHLDQQWWRRATE